MIQGVQEAVVGRVAAHLEIFLRAGKVSRHLLHRLPLGQERHLPVQPRRGGGECVPP